jgi:hypothetical protein
MDKLTQATISLFNAVPVEEDATFAKPDSRVFKHTLKNGYLFDSRIPVDWDMVKYLDEVIGIGGEKLNSTFHKSWAKMAYGNLQDLYAQQVLHYITTYGFESLGLFEDGTVYVPAERLDIPKVDVENLPLILIGALTPSEILDRIVKLGSSSVALSGGTLDNLMCLVEGFGYHPDFVTLITNREFRSRLNVLYNIIPDQPVEYLRYVIMKLTDESLLIKSPALIDKIKKANGKTLDALLVHAPDNLASIFFRYKPLFLAMKKISAQKWFFNALRKKADVQHEPMGVDYLNDITRQISAGELKINTFRHVIGGATIWRKIRLLNALMFRYYADSDSIVYRIRNGKTWVSEFNKNNTVGKLAKVIDVVTKSIAEQIRMGVDGVTFYIPSHVHYAVPATEKMFVGNVPSNSYIDIGKRALVGVHWYDADNKSFSRNSVDIDLSLIDVSGKYGWDGYYRSDEANVVFSGDMTSAPRPDGASEFFRVTDKISAKLVRVNHFTHGYFPEGTVTPCTLIVGKAKKDMGKDYMISQENVLATQNISLTEKGTILGMLIPVEESVRFYFIGGGGVDKLISARLSKYTGQEVDFFVNSCLTTPSLKYILELAGANVVDEIPENGEYVNLSPEALSKDTILSILSAK